MPNALDGDDRRPAPDNRTPRGHDPPRLRARARWVFVRGRVPVETLQQFGQHLEAQYHPRTLRFVRTVSSLAVFSAPHQAGGDGLVRDKTGWPRCGRCRSPRSREMGEFNGPTSAQTELRAGVAARGSGARHIQHRSRKSAAGEGSGRPCSKPTTMSAPLDGLGECAAPQARRAPKMPTTS